MCSFMPAMLLAFSLWKPVSQGAGEAAAKLAWPLESSGASLVQHQVLIADNAQEATVQQKTDINSCTFEDLVRLPGIGPKKARAILDERSKRPFRNIHDLTRVKGIGQKTVRKLAPYITATQPAK